jgi:hypothetical protein
MAFFVDAILLLVAELKRFNGLFQDRKHFLKESKKQRHHSSNTSYLGTTSEFNKAP